MVIIDICMSGALASHKVQHIVTSVLCKIHIVIKVMFACRFCEFLPFKQNEKFTLEVFGKLSIRNF